MSDQVRNGYREIRVHFTIEGDAPDEQLRAIVEQSRDRSAVYDVLTNGTRVVLDVTTPEPGAAGGRSRPPAGRPAPSRVRQSPAGPLLDPRPSSPPKEPSCPPSPLVVVGAGPAGLAVSPSWACAASTTSSSTAAAPAESWRSRRWDSLRLLSPGWATRLPGLPPADDPDAFLTATDFVTVLEHYAAASAAPVVEHAQVLSVRRCGDGYRVVSTAGTWTANAVVIATGDAGEPAVPAVAARLPATSTSWRPSPTAARPSCPTVASWWWGRRHPGCSSPTSSPSAAVTSCWPSAGTPGWCAPTAGSTSTGGWSGWAASTAGIDQVADPSSALREPSLQLVGHAGGRTTRATSASPPSRPAACVSPGA